MAPSPDNDTAPKAPDEADDDESGRRPQDDPNKDKKPENALNELNDRELQDLLEEAVNYKNPTDREGKSILFKYLLNEAEQEERNSRASRAGGSERVRYHNPSAKRSSKHGRKKPNSVSEDMMHGGSLDNLNQEELYEHAKKTAKKSVSARQKEGGSLPSNVNAGAHLDIKYFQEEKEKREVSSRLNVTEAKKYLDHNSLDHTIKKSRVQPQEEIPMKFITTKELEIGNVDDPMHISSLESAIERKITDGTKYQGIIVPNNCKVEDVKKVDENGNALQQNCVVKAKKKKSQTEKNVVIVASENVEGHRGDIIDDVNKLMEFIGVTNDKNNRSLKSKQLHRHSTSEDKTNNKKHQRAHSSKSKEDGSKLKKSNSLGEISTTALLEDFGFRPGNEKVLMRANKVVDKPRERRSWGDVEPPPFDNLYSNPSGESLEAAEFRVVTKKKKSRKRAKASMTSAGKCGQRAPSSPDLRRKSAYCSVPHSEKSNDSSSDLDSVHSLPIDPQRSSGNVLNMPISYADIARNSDTNMATATTNNNNNNCGSGGNVSNNNKANKDKKSPNNIISSNNSGAVATGNSPAIVVVATGNNNNNSNASVSANDYKYELPPLPVENAVAPPPDFNNFKNFPAITNNKGVAASPPVVKSNNTKIVKSKPNDISVLRDYGGPPVAFLPHDIPDVSTIEKLQLIGQGHHHVYDTFSAANHNNNNDNDVDDYECTDYCDRTTSTNDPDSDCDDPSAGVRPPPVVILSGNRDKVVPGLVFGFDINEQLLQDGDGDFAQDFVTRYVPPKVYTPTSHNHDKIVTFIGSAWDEVVFNMASSGGGASSNDDNNRVRYYSDLL